MPKGFGAGGAEEDGRGEALSAGPAIQTEPPFPLLEEVLRLTSLVVPGPDLEGSLLLDGPMARHRVVEIRIFGKQVRLSLPLPFDEETKGRIDASHGVYRLGLLLSTRGSSHSDSGSPPLR